MKPFIARAYNNFTLDEKRSITTKSSSTDRLQDEINYYTKIHATEFSCFFPRLFSSDENKGSMSLEYYNYKDLGKQLIKDENGIDLSILRKWEVIAQKLSDVLQMFKNSSARTKLCTTPRDNKNMYIDKTLHYYKELIDNFEYFTDLSKRDKINVNGQTLYSLDSIWKYIEEKIESIIDANHTTVIHGDMCFSNVLYSYDENQKNASVIKFIDPRGRFGQRGIYGDPLYDVAKLIHSYEGRYEYIINDEFDISFDSSDIKYNFKYPDSKYKISDVFHQFEMFRNPTAKLISGLIFIGMCSRHYDSLERQIIMYCTGLNILNEAIK